MSREHTILVLGAYGIVGRELTRVLATRTSAQVLAGGRRRERLLALAEELGSPRVRPHVLDAHDLPALATAAHQASLVVNCVGPYVVGGAEVARTALEAGASYIDLASEQAHFLRLQEYADAARQRDRFLLTGAGLVPGLSGVLAAHGARQLPAVECVEMVYAQARAPDAEGGLGTALTGLLEASQSSVALRDGQRVPLRLGEARRRMQLPAPLGEVEVLEVPSLETLTLAERLGARSVSTWGYFGRIPASLLWAVRLLRPERRRWAYRWLGRLTQAHLRREFQSAVARGIGPEAWLWVSVEGGGRRWRAELRLPEGGAIPTAYLPTLAARRFLEGRLRRSGVLTPIDGLDAGPLLQELEDLGWKLDLRTELTPVP